jgi:serine/threonine protein kinase
MDLNSRVQSGRERKLNKPYRVHTYLKLKPSTSEESLRPQTAKINLAVTNPVTANPDKAESTNVETIKIKEQLKEVGSYGAVVVSTDDSRVVKIYDPAFYSDAEEANREFENEMSAYNSILKNAEATKHIATGFAHGTIEGSTVHYIALNEIEGKPLDDYFDEADSSMRKDIMTKLIQADCDILFQGRVNNDDLHPGNVIVTREKTVRIVDFGRSAVIKSDIKAPYRNPLFRWVWRAEQWAEYGAFESQEQALEWMWGEYSKHKAWASVIQGEDQLEVRRA